MKHEIVYCNLCEVWNLRCSECEMGGCSGGHKENCTKWKEEITLAKYLERLFLKTNLEELLNERLECK